MKRALCPCLGMAGQRCGAFFRWRAAGVLCLLRLLRFYPRQRGGNLTAVILTDGTFCLLMTVFPRQFFPLKTLLARFKTGLRLHGAFRFQVDSAKLCFLLTVILHQRNVAGADPGTGSAFNAVGNVVLPRLIVIASTAVPVKLLWQQGGRTGIGTGTTTDAGFFALLFARFAGGRGQNTVGDLHHRHIQRWQGKAHQRAAHHHHLTAGWGKVCAAQQMADWCANSAPDVARLAH